MNALEVNHLTVYYGNKPALWGVDLKIESGRLVGVMGPNGAGKSTFVKSITGLLPQQDTRISGELKIFGQDPSKVRLRVAYVPQRESIDWDFPVSVYDVVMMGRYGRLGLFRRPGRRDREKVFEALERVDLVDLSDRQIGNLSGGQQQRVFIARALVQEADLYLMDEPFAGVDVVTERALLKVMKELVAQNKTLLVVHHDVASAPHYFDELVLLNGRVVAAGPLKDVYRPEILNEAFGGRYLAPGVSHANC